MKIQKSAEDYLETILILYNRRGTVHAIDIANELAFSKPSVSVAMKNLRENGYITVNENNEISLTEPGRKIAETIYERHTLLSGWLMALGVDPEIAVEDACRMEHVISAESFAAIKNHVQNLSEVHLRHKDVTLHAETNRDHPGYLLFRKMLFHRCTAADLGNGRRGGCDPHCRSFHPHQRIHRLYLPGSDSRYPQIAAHWKGLDLHFDGIYTGYLGSREQVQIVADFFDLFRKRTPPSWWIRSWETAEKCMPDSRRTLPGKCESFAQKQT